MAFEFALCVGARSENILPNSSARCLSISLRSGLFQTDVGHGSAQLAHRRPTKVKALRGGPIGGPHFLMRPRGWPSRSSPHSTSPSSSSHALIDAAISAGLADVEKRRTFSGPRSRSYKSITGPYLSLNRSIRSSTVRMSTSSFRWTSRFRTSSLSGMFPVVGRGAGREGKEGGSGNSRRRKGRGQREFGQSLSRGRILMPLAAVLFY
mmetsp:Transcript_28667/g.66596  ORF Transcript_28667/g.66596 Transcript_28667/m.66596 type:complete len:208 (+) Transcript_28667:31-654(+)